MTRTGSSASARLARIAGAVRAHAPALAGRDGTYFEAAVALILRETRDDDVELLFIKRATREDDPWSGQIALPGGRHQASDASLEETAVRETREEVGLELDRHGAIIGALDELRPRTAVLPPVIVRPFVATVGPPRASARATRSRNCSGRRSTRSSIPPRRATPRSSCGSCAPSGPRSTTEVT